MSAKKPSLVAQAYEQSKETRRDLQKRGRLMETTEDKAGIVWERYAMPEGHGIILFATPSWHDTFVRLQR